MYWIIVGIKHWHHVLRSVPGRRELFMMLPLVCGSVGAKSTGATVHMAKGAWEQEQE